MKKFLSLIAALAASVGIICFLVGMTMLGWDFTKLDTTVWESKVYESTQQIETVDLNFSSAKVIFKKGDAFKMEYEESDRTKFKIEEENGEISVTEHWTWKFIMFNFKSANVTITLPDNIDNIEIKNTNGDINLEAFSGKTLELQTVNGSISLKDCNYTEEAKLKSSNGKIDLNNFSSESLEMETVNGQIKAEGIQVSGAVAVNSFNDGISLNMISAGTLETTSTNGKVLVANATVKGLAFAESFNSSVTFNGVEAGAITLQNFNGKIEINGCKAERGAIQAKTNNSNITGDNITAKSVYFKNSNGAIKVKNLNASEIVGETSNASIELDINGQAEDYKILEATATNGTVNAPPSGNGDKTIIAKTRNGNVTITIG